MGRPSEMVQKDITPAGTDLVTGMMYDAYGRDSLHWLPGATAVGNNGAYVSNYATLASSTNGGDANPYSRTDYEASPLNRVTGQYGPGADWYTNGKKVTTAYLTNGPSDVKYFYVSNNSLIGDNYYAAATLYGLQTTDEDGKTVEVFTDKQGRKILSRVDGNTDTYYVYDDLNNLRYVLPPLASDVLGGAGLNTYNETNTTLDLYGYLYHYDGRNRCVMKKLPGCNPIYMVYDKADRLVATQDGNQRLKRQWTINKYDQLGRLLYSGIAISDSTTITNDFSGNVYNEIFTNTTTPTGGYSCSGGITLSRLLMINYYNDYSFLNLSTYSTIKSTLTGTALNGYTAHDLSHTHGLLTGTCIYHLDNPTKYEVTSIYYDKYGHTVQTCATNHLGGYDITCDSLNFSEKPTKTYTTHSINGTTPSVSEVYAYTYDKAQRLLSTTLQLNGGAKVILASNSYDELGRVRTKTVGSGLYATTYSYNERSWVTGISGNRFYENLYYNTNTANLPNFTSSYNGNISAIKWSIPADNIGNDRVYTFSYDGINRLINANYEELRGGTVQTDIGGRNYYEYFGYDKQGNITDLWRNGLLSVNGSSMSYATIDAVSFKYKGNQLSSAAEAAIDGSFYGDEEYVDLANGGIFRQYDKNGNSTCDINSHVWGIHYNVLNLPDTIQFYEGHQTDYTYTADGTKLQVTDKTSPEAMDLPISSLNQVLKVVPNAVITTTDYCGNYIYENGGLAKILTPEGYVNIPSQTYCYFLKDHLGSNRVVLQQDGTIIERDNYYPSGARFGESAVNGGNVQPYRHTGMEMQGMHGLNWIDNEARMRSVNVPEFTTMDPLAEDNYEVSPYAYAVNNPINYTDPNGMDTTINRTLAEVTITAPKHVHYSNINLIGQTVLEPISGFWEYLSYFWFGRTYFEGGLTWNVNMHGVATGVAPLSGTIDVGIGGEVGTYLKLVRLTKGLKGTIQAHHLVEVRHLERMLKSIKNAPSVIMTRADHAAMTKTLQQLLPYGRSYSKSEIIDAYKEAYKNNKEWLNAAIEYLK